MQLESRPLCFEQPRQAVQLKLTVALWEALRTAKEAGEKVTMTVGGANVITVGNQVFPFKGHPVSLQDIVKVPEDPSQPCTEVAQVVQRLHVQRTLSEAERERVRLRGLEAETQRRGRTAQVLSKAPKPSQVRKVTSKTVTRSATPPVGRPLQPKQPARAVPPGRNGTPPPNRATPPPGGAPKSKANQPLSKLGKARRTPTPGPSAGFAAAPLLALEAARRKCGLPKVLLACIGNERPKKPRLDQMLADIANRVPGFKPSKDEVTRTLKDVAEYKSPGVYVLHAYALKRELPALQKELESTPGPDPPSRTPSLEPEAKPGVSEQKGHQATPKLSPARHASPAPGQKRSPTPTAYVDWSQQRPMYPSAAPAENLQATQKPVVARQEQRATTPVMTAGTAKPAAKDSQMRKRQRSATPRQQGQERTAAPQKENPEAQQNPNAQPATHFLQASGGVSPRGVGAVAQEAVDRRAVQIADSSTPVQPEVLPEPFGENSSLEEADDSWYEEFARAPQLGRGVLVTRQQFDALYDEHERMYAVYAKLARHIDRFKRNYHSIVAASEAANVPEQRTQFIAQAEMFYNDKAPRARQQDTAMKTLHTELTEIKGLLTQFFEERWLESRKFAQTEQLTPQGVAAR